MNKTTVAQQAKTTPFLPLAQGILQRKCTCGNHTVSGGECAECAKKKSGLQRKLAIGASNDPLEHEADRVADQVMVPQAFTSERKTFECVQPVHDMQTTPVKTNWSDHPLPFLDTIQSSFGHHDISHVRVRTDTRAAAEAWAIGAEAFTRDSEVTFSRTPSLHTAAHEATHVIQQRAGVNVTGGIGREGDSYERHADEVADRVVRGQSSEALLDASPEQGGLRSDAVQDSARAHHQVATSRTPVIQMRRIPPNVQALLTAAGAGGADGPNFAANASGVQRLIDRAMAELTAADRTMALNQRRGALTEAQFTALPLREQLSRHANAIIALFPSQQLGDPNLIDTGPRSATADAANITKVVGHVDTIFNDIASGARDTWLKQVFGAGSIVAAKTKYAKGRTAMNNLHGTNSILTDRSGYSEEVGLGGLTDPPGTANQKIRVEKSIIDNPDGKESITTLLHESMHAGNADVADQYVGFETETEAHKLTFSSCFEVVPWRILDPTDSRAFPVVPATVPPTFKTFIPAGTSVGGVSAPALTKAEKGAKAASELFREAWTIGLNLHPFYVNLLHTPTNWTAPQPEFGGKRFNNSLPFWSKVEKLTIHTKSTIDPASPEEAKHPVTQIDVALSEGLIRKLSNGMNLLSPLQKEPDILAFETAKAAPAELTAAFPGGSHNNIDTERKFLLKLTARDPKVAPMTGTVDRDLRVIDRLGKLNWGKILDPRNPNSFPD